jgi:hypothetical protein
MGNTPPPWDVTHLLDRALGGDADALARLDEAQPADERDALLALVRIHDLHVAPLERLGGAERFQHHPCLAALKARLEDPLLARLDREAVRAGDGEEDDEDAVAGMRRIATADLVPAVYEWLAEDASYDEMVEFLAIEGGPDGGFDDYVAICQVGIDGEAKVTLGANYWDEMGRGTLAAVHTELHRRLAGALGLVALADDAMPIEALRRAALNGLLATNRALQPEMLGALGLLELQAGPRCRKVVRALERLDAPRDAFPFYEEHAQADPRHGKAWLDHAVAPIVERTPAWGPRILRGARWRSVINRELFDALAARFRAHNLAA